MSLSRRASLAFSAIVLLWLAAGASARAAEVALPKDGFAPGWVKSEPAESYPKTALFSYIDGGAELFLEFGFTKLTVQTYARAELELTLEVYEMENAEAALGIYLMKAGKEASVKGISARNTGDRYQLTLVRDRWFIHVNNPDGLPGAVPAMKLLADSLLAGIPEGKRVTLLDALPPKNLVQGSERIFRGPFGLQAIYTLGPGDILLQKGKAFGVAGDYRDPESGTVTRVLVPYPTLNEAREALDNLRHNLDSYLVIVDNYDLGFVFHDFQDKYGQVELKANWLEITLGLATKPYN